MSVAVAVGQVRVDRDGQGGGERDVARRVGDHGRVAEEGLPWAWLPGPGRGLSKNSRVNLWFGVLSSVPAIVLPPMEVSTG